MAPVLLTAVALLSGCRDEKKSAARHAAAEARRVRDAAEQAIRSGAAATAQMQFRGVQVYPQAMPQRTAVCGQVSPFPDDPTLFVPFVSLVIARSGQDAAAPRYQFEQHIATSTSEASRVYLAIVDYCYDQGGPTPGPYHSVMPLPPFPDAIPNPSSRDRSPAPSGTTPSSSRAMTLGSVSMRRSGNLRFMPHGPVVRVMPQGTVMRVFSEAPGGWLQVGEKEPWGWVHESQLERH